MTSLAIVVAMATNRAIGKDNQLLWHLPEDLKYFKRITMGKPMIMGRKTFESIGRPLPGRVNIVVTRQSDWQRDGVRVVPSIENAIKVAEAQAFIDGVDEIMMIGGAELYTATLPLADKIYLTRVDADIEGDAFFPDINENQWQETSRKTFSSSATNPYNYAFCVLEKIHVQTEKKR